MTEQLREIGRRLSDLRSIMEIGETEFCAATGVTPDELSAYEKGEKDFSFSFLYSAAGLLGVDIMDIMSGDSPKLSTCSIVRAGEGFAVDRRASYSYRHLASTFKQKKAEPFLVTVEPKEETPTLHAHEGQEFNYMVSGRMMFYIGEMSYELGVGDSVFFDAAVPHAMKALGGEAARFLAVVIGSNGITH